MSPVVELARMIEELVLPTQMPVWIEPILFGSAPAGKRLDEWYLAEAVTAEADAIEVRFRDGGRISSVLRVEAPGQWSTCHESLVIEDAARVCLVSDSAGTAQVGGWSRTLDYRARPGAYLDPRGRRVRWFPPSARARPGMLGASRVPALRLDVLMPVGQAVQARPGPR